MLPYFLDVIIYAYSYHKRITRIHEFIGLKKIISTRIYRNSEARKTSFTEIVIMVFDITVYVIIIR